ncbi:MAG: F0F1 ATP synthase subunit A [Flavobacteriales bacterium]|nr:F0F1 ATP synthase subunit A [Flavobacteriales bacterium]MDW8409930.1 F0F1 ATP synthase subunit A [Flavobacteriales bacterium]
MPTWASGNQGKGFDAGQMIGDHILDAHEIHFFTLHEGQPDEVHISVPLPVILYSREFGWDVFWSSAFHHGREHQTAEHSQNATYSADTPIHTPKQPDHSELPPGAHAYGPYILYKHKIYLAEDGGLRLGPDGKPLNKRPLDLSITKNVAGIFLAFILLFLLFRAAAKAYQRQGVTAPKGFQNVLETLILFVRDEIAKPSIGPKYEKFLPYLLTVFFFIFTCNLLGLIPFIGGFNITGNIAVTLTLAAFTFALTCLNGNASYWSHIFWPPGVPKVLYPLLIPIEIMGMFNKPLVLMLRLFANITAGHIIILSFVALIFIFSALFGPLAGYATSPFSMLFTIFMNLLELLVAFLQAYVFTLLSAIYFGQAVEEHHHSASHVH